MEQFNILIVRPPELPFYHAYTGMARILAAALKRLGHPTRLVQNELVHDATNVIVGAHNLDPALADTLPAGTIIYNSEAVLSHSVYLPTLRAFVRRFESWDYSASNARAWREPGVSERVRWLRPGYVPECTTIDPARATDIDVLSYRRVRTMLAPPATDGDSGVTDGQKNGGTAAARRCRPSPAGARCCRRRGRRGSSRSCRRTRRRS